MKPTPILALLNIAGVLLKLTKSKYSEGKPFCTASLIKWFTAYSSAHIGGSGHVCK